MTRRLKLPSSPNRPNRKTPPLEKAFRAVEVRCREPCCAAVRPLDGRRYLTGEAPLLPLPNCDRPLECQCSYRHRSDRRSGARRGAESGLPTPNPPAQAERRTQDGRRVTDREQEQSLDDPFADTYYDFVAKKPT